MSQRFDLGEQHIEISQPDASARGCPSFTFRIGIRFIVALVRGLVIDCGCFGALAKREVGTVSLSIATILLAVSGIGIYAEPSRDGQDKCG